MANASAISANPAAIQRSIPAEQRDFGKKFFPLYAVCFSYTWQACIELGGIYWGPAISRTRVATEACFLHLQYAFETLGYRRFEWKCNNLNEASKRAALRFGFSFEGVFRQHMMIKGKNRDTAWFSIIDQEWPAVKAGFEAWLNPENFDSQGQQIERLQINRETGS